MKVVGLVAASIRPQYLDELRAIALQLDVPLLIQPRKDDTHRMDEFMEALEAVAPDGMLCNSYSMIIPEKMIDLVGGRAFNVHFSLLPLNRGPNPIQWAIIHGQGQTGVTIHVIDKGLDTGPIVDQQVVRISDEDTWVTLRDKVSEAAEHLLKRAVPELLTGYWTATPQKENFATVNKRIPREGFVIDLDDMDDDSVFNLIRAQVHPLKGVGIKMNGTVCQFDRYIDKALISSLRHDEEKR